MTTTTPLDPMARFTELFERAKREEVSDATAMALATVRSGRPSARMVLLKGHDERGFTFFTNYESRKAEEIESAGFAALCFYWHKMYVQVRIEGSVARVSPKESDEYFASRPRGHRLGAWSSNQSRPIDSALDLQAQFVAVEKRFREEAPVPRPDHWGGYCVIPYRIEFWFGRENRMHEREVYERDAPSSPWRLFRLQP